MDLPAHTKIWRYMDTGTFLSVLTDRALFFAATTQFKDPYETTMPRSHATALRQMISNQVASMRATQEEARTRGYRVEAMDPAIVAFESNMLKAITNIHERFGISCWHENEGESEAMWRLYSLQDQGIAIESTVGQLRESLISSADTLTFDRVRYVNFEDDPIDMGHANYQLFMKRKSFEHEREIRVTTLLPEANYGKGQLLSCDLDILITRVHTSPLLHPHVSSAVEKLCRGTLATIAKPVVRSALYARPAPLFD